MKIKIRFQYVIHTWKKVKLELNNVCIEIGFNIIWKVQSFFAFPSKMSLIRSNSSQNNNHYFNIIKSLKMNAVYDENGVFIPEDVRDSF